MSVKPKSPKNLTIGTLEAAKKLLLKPDQRIELLEFLKNQEDVSDGGDGGKELADRLLGWVASALEQLNAAY